ncbi:MAG TPA: hypothetical protein PKV88_04825 [Bacteroidales bacterium]|jgi:hypothetical protein|nr:hypothetical protein [Bacteroidales bacterium]MDY0084658.1 hypothetical protein [Bacteroidales bacterium]HPE43384.1 hypothetical protein [Bacteroidales bacterium]
MRKGLIVELHPQRGYGFVKEQLSGAMFRFNTAELADQLQVHEQVVFNLLELDPGNMAVNIRKSNTIKQTAG